MTAEAVAVLTRGHQLFAGNDSDGDVGAGGRASGPADRISAAIAGGGLPAGAVDRSGAAVAGMQRLAGSDGALAAILGDARADRQQAARATRVILDAAIADPIPAGDTPMGRREAMLRMIARLRAQHGHVVRTRAQAIVLAARLRRLLYASHMAHMGDMGGDAAPAGASGRPAVLAAIRRALDIKGIFDPVARAHWERGMDLVASRESGYRADAINGWDSNAAKGTPSIGAWQFIQPTFDAYREPGTSPSIRNLVSQACAFINYAQGRYGVAASGWNLADRIQQADPRRGPRGY
ncbi:MAG: transglycosylase [Mycolicibacterium sp.]|uniref:transglycosylase SLT domain-containing protein n=1 Tax=Mycolicibacterium sp. TaxID=2320850 RepID=UPI003D1506D5